MTTDLLEPIAHGIAQPILDRLADPLLDRVADALADRLEHAIGIHRARLRRDRLERFGKALVDRLLDPLACDVAHALPHRVAQALDKLRLDRVAHARDDRLGIVGHRRGADGLAYRVAEPLADRLGHAVAHGILHALADRVGEPLAEPALDPRHVEAALRLGIEQRRAQLAEQAVAHHHPHALARSFGQLLVYALGDALAQRVLDPGVHVATATVGHVDSAAVVHRLHRRLHRKLQTLGLVHVAHVVLLVGKCSALA